MISIKLEAEKERLKCKCFEISASILNFTTQTLQEHMQKIRLKEFKSSYIQGLFKLYCRHKLNFSRNNILSNNLEKNVKIKVSGNYGNFPQDPNCEQVFIFQRNLMLVIDKKDSLAFTRKDVIYEVPSYLLNIASEVYKTIHFELEYINGESLTEKEQLDLMYILQNE